MSHIFKCILLMLLIALTINEVKCSFKFLLLHTNDMHGRYMEVNQDRARCQEPSGECYGGFARVKAAVQHFTEQAKEKNMPTLYLDAGDISQGTVFYTVYKWKLAAKMMKLLQPQAMSLGEHDFDDGIEGVTSFIREAGVPIVCCNIDTTQEPSLRVQPSVVIALGKPPNTAKVGIVGYLPQDMSWKPRPQQGNVKILDVIESLEAEAKRLRIVEKVNIIIALGHSGYKMDKKIANKLNDIDIIVGGHSHTFLYSGQKRQQDIVSGPYPTIVTSPDYDVQKSIPIVQASYGTKYLGYLELEFDDNWRLKNYKGQPVLLTGSMEQDPVVLDAMKEEVDYVTKHYRKKIGYTEVTLKGDNNYCKLEECALGNMIADAFVDYVNSNHTPDNGKRVTIGLMDGESIKGSLYTNTREGYTGEITLEDVLGVLPLNNKLEVLELTGSELRYILEMAMRDFYQKNGYGEVIKADLIQVSGLKLWYDARKGQRLVSVKVAPKYEDLDDNEVYNVVMPDSISKKEYSALLNDNKRVVSMKDEDQDITVVAKFITKKQVFRKHEKYSGPDDRIFIRLYKKTERFRMRGRDYISRHNPFHGRYG